MLWNIRDALLAYLLKLATCTSYSIEQLFDMVAVRHPGAQTEICSMGKTETDNGSLRTVSS